MATWTLYPDSVRMTIYFFGKFWPFQMAVSLTLTLLHWICCLYNKNEKKRKITSATGAENRSMSLMIFYPLLTIGFYIPANSHPLGVSLTPVGWKLRSHAGSRLRANFSPWLKTVSCCRLAWHNFQKYVNSGPCKERKLCVKWINDNTYLAISDFLSEKHWERARV